MGKEMLIQPSLNRVDESQLVTVNIPQEFSDTGTLEARDNNGSSQMVSGPNNKISFTTDYVVEESSGSLKRKVDFVFPSTYENTAQLSQQTTFRFEMDSGASIRNVKIWLEKGTREAGFSCWRFVSNQSTVMLLTEGAFNPNSEGKISDINLLAPMFASKTVGFNVLHTSTDVDIKVSFNTFKHV